MNEPPEVLDAGEEFTIISEVQPLCSPNELLPVPGVERPSLVDSVPLFGLLLVAKGGTLVVKRSSTILSRSGGDGSGSEVWCGGRITHITHACDGLTVFVVTIWGDDCPHLLCFDSAALVQQGSSAKPYLECSNSSSAGSRVLGLAVNPTDPSCVAYCTSTGDLTVLNISNNSVTYNTKKNMGARALGWSAKGKQMCVGCQDGSLSLHKPDLTPVRTIAAPPLSTGAATPVTALVWFTNTEFFVAYQQNNNQPCLVYVNGPKGQPAQYINYDDVCYSNESSEPLFYHLLFIPQWNQLLVLSSGGIEMATVIKTAGGSWAQLALEEGSRAEMHFINVTQETFPLGMTLDLCSTKTFTFKEDVTEGPHPVVVALSTGGELNIFHLVNKMPDKPDLRASLPAQQAPTAPVRTAQQYCSNIVIPPPARGNTAALCAPADTGTASTTGPASSSFSSNFSNPNSAAGFTSVSSTTVSATAPGTNASVFANSSVFSGFTAPNAAASSASFLSGSSTVMSASTGSTLFSGSTGSSGGLFSRAAAPSSSGSSLFGGASLFSQTKTTTSSLFGGGTSLNVAAPTTSVATPGSTPNPAPAAAFSFAGSTSAFSVPGAQSTGGSSLFKAAPAAAGATPERPAAPDAVSPPRESSKPPAVADGGAVAAVAAAGSNYRAPGPPAAQGTTSVSNNRASPSVGEHQQQQQQQQQQLAQPGSRSARSATQEVALLAQALKEQELFEAELHEHLALCACNEYKGGWETTMEAVQSALQNQQTFLDQQQQQVGEVSKGVSELHADLLEFYSTFETTKAAVQQLKDPRCNQLSEWRGLTRSSERQLQQLRDQVHYIQRELSYASAALDSLSSSRGRPAPHSRSGVTTVYRAAQLGRNARVSCEQRLDELSAKLKQLSVTGDLASSPHKDKKTTRTGRYGISEESLLVEEKENLNCDMTKDKQQQLWAILQRRGPTPVRKSGEAVLSPYAKGVKSPMQPRQLHEPSFLSLSFGPGKCSTPNVPEGAPRQTSDSSAAGRQALCDTPKSGWQASSMSAVRSANVKAEPAEPGVAKYEDITPPGTPEVETRAQEDHRAVSSHPLSALSSLVGKVPPTTAVSVLPQGSLNKAPDTPKSSTSAFSFRAFVPPKPELKFASSSEKDGLNFFAGSSSGFSSSLSTGTSTIVTTTSVLFSNVTSSASSGVAGRPFTTNSGGSIFGGTLVQPGTPTAALATASSSGGGALAAVDLTTTNPPSSSSAESATKNSDFFTKGSVSITPVNKPSFLTEGASGNGNISGLALPANDQSDRATARGLGVTGVSTSSQTSVSSNQAGISVVSPSDLFSATSSSLFKPQTPTPANSSLSFATTTSALNTFTTTEVKETANSGLFAPAKTSSSLFATVTSTENLASGNSVSTTSTSASSVFVTSASSGVAGELVTVASSSITAGALTTGAGITTFSSSTTLGSEATSGNSVFSFVAKTTGTSGISLFGTPTSTSASLFATSVPASTSSFGAPTSSISVFSTTGSSSGTACSTTSTSAFGATVSSTGVFSAPISASTSTFGVPVSSSSVSENPVSSSSSVFGSLATSSSSVFGIPASSSNSIFGTPATSSTSVFGNPASSSSSVFGNPAASSSGSVFGASVSSASSVFGTAATSSSSVFGTPAASSGSVFGAPATSSSSVFGAPATSSSSVFGAPATSSSSVFGAPATSSSSVFGAPATSSSSVFGAPATSSSSVFGAPATSSGSVFGAPATSSGSVFGAPATSSASVFGAPATSTNSLFGSLPSSGSVFGAPAFGAPASTAASLFGSAVSSGSPFVAPATCSASTFGGSGSVFGAPASSSGSVFGTPSVFGTATASTQSSVFGSSSDFGVKPAQSAGGTGSAFGSGSSVFGGGASASSSSGSLFGGAAPASTSSASVFGSGGGGQSLAFGSSASTGGSVFGGGGATFGSSSGSSVFGGAAGGGGASSSSVFGGGAILTGLGSAAPSNSTNKNIFGISGSAVKPQTDLFGGSGSGAAAVSSAPSLFGGSTGSALSKPASAFGAAPAFGSPPKFGSGPAFGSPPAFGGSVFGGATAPASGSGVSGGFSSFANSSGTATFGGLAASGSSSNSFGTGASSPFNTSSIGGGSSFTNWR